MSSQYSEPMSAYLTSLKSACFSVRGRIVTICGVPSWRDGFADPRNGRGGLVLLLR